MRLPCKDQVTNRETHPDDPSQAPDPVARVKSEPDSEGRDESPVTENCEDVPDQTNSEDFEREEGEPLAEIFKDPLTAMAEQGRLVMLSAMQLIIMLDCESRLVTIPCSYVKLSRPRSMHKRQQ